MWYRRAPPSVTSLTRVTPASFLTVPERNPRTLWGCQPVAFRSSARLAPFGRCSISVQVRFLVLARLLVFWLFDGPEVFDFEDGFFAMSGSLWLGTATIAVLSPPKARRRCPGAFDALVQCAGLQQYRSVGLGSPVLTGKIILFSDERPSGDGRRRQRRDDHSLNEDLEPTSRVEGGGYRDNPQRRVRHHVKWTNFTPPFGPILLRR